MINDLNLPGWFKEPGAYVLVDGQFGSTGKGLMAAVLAEYANKTGDVPNVVTTNAGPNSGHTAYFDFWNTAKENPALGEQGYGKIVTQQLPVASVFLERLGHKPLTYLNAGAVIDSLILNEERAMSQIPPSRLIIHPTAAVISPMDRAQDQQTVREIAGTGKGIGPAIANKVRRVAKVAYDEYRPMLPASDGFGIREWDSFWRWNRDVVFVETAQGFSLGLNSARFYPNVTSRECTVMQAISDARIPASRVQKSIACFRTYPIRVGNTQGSSGGCYEDQQEVTWESIGVAPEITTVTKRVRRVFTWSRIQFRECVAANEPDVIFLNFINYLPDDQYAMFVNQAIDDYVKVLGRRPDAVLIGMGPHNHHVEQVM